MNNLILIGMPGVGKSSLGVVLAKVLGYHFVDSDLVIQAQEKRLLREIIETQGNEAFLEIENRINAGINAEKTVIATGGSVIYGKEAMAHFKEIGKILYLRASYDTINSRLSNLTGRGVAINKNQTLRDLYNERIPLYEKYADLTVDVDGLTIEEIVCIIRNML
ncbi:MAG: shikimate kinase [Butyrivibrio sp.]